jgi:hypothetical protein
MIRKTGTTEYHTSAGQKKRNKAILRRLELMYLGHAYLTDEDEVRINGLFVAALLPFSGCNLSLCPGVDYLHIYNFLFILIRDVLAG